MFLSVTERGQRDPNRECVCKKREREQEETVKGRRGGRRRFIDTAGASTWKKSLQQIIVWLKRSSFVCVCIWERRDSECMSVYAFYYAPEKHNISALHCWTNAYACVYCVFVCCHLRGCGVCFFVFVCAVAQDQINQHVSLSYSLDLHTHSTHTNTHTARIHKETQPPHANLSSCWIVKQCVSCWMCAPPQGHVTLTPAVSRHDY